MKSQIGFTRHEVDIEETRRVDALGSDEVLRRQIDAHGEQEGTLRTYIISSAVSADLDWCRCGQPYCKVYPRMAGILRDIDLNSIPVSEFHLPYSTFEVCLPTAQYHGSLLISRLACANDDRVHMFQQRNQEFLSHSFSLRRGPSIGDSILREYDGSPMPPDVVALWSIAVSVALFMVDNHKLVCPDLEPRLIRTRRNKNEKRGTRQPGTPSTSLTLGREIELPHPQYSTPDHGDAGGNELTHSHARRGHLRHQPCGPGLKERKLIFVMPTVVRPDLPPSPTPRGYFIPGQSTITNQQEVHS